MFGILGGNSTPDCCSPEPEYVQRQLSTIWDNVQNAQPRKVYVHSNGEVNDYESPGAVGDAVTTLLGMIIKQCDINLDPRK